MVIGYNSSGDCNDRPRLRGTAVLTDFFHCGNPQLFEDIVTAPGYSVRTAPTARWIRSPPANIFSRKCRTSNQCRASTQDYSWGQDSWTEFKAAMSALKPDIQYSTASFTKLWRKRLQRRDPSTLLSNPADALFSQLLGRRCRCLRIAILEPRTPRRSPNSS